MGYIEARHAAPGTSVSLIVRGKPLDGSIVSLPFVPHRYDGVRPSGSDTVVQPA
jgi:aminomethyltransferase